METQLKEHLDRTELTELVAREAAWLDEHRYEGADRFFTEDVSARTPGGEVKGLEALVALATKDHARFERTHHQPTGIVVDLNGDTATVRFSAHLALVEQGGETILATARYRLDARRTGAGWRFSSLEIDPVSQVHPTGSGLADRAELTDLIARHSVWIDEGRWDETDRIFTEDVVTISPRGETRGIESLLALVGKGHDAFARTVHNKSNLVIDLDGDTAAVRAHDLAVFVVDDTTVSIASGIAHYRARRTSEGWRFFRLEIEPAALTGPIDRASLPVPDRKE